MWHNSLFYKRPKIEKRAYDNAKKTELEQLKKIYIDKLQKPIKDSIFAFNFLEDLPTCKTEDLETSLINAIHSNNDYYNSNHAYAVYFTNIAVGIINYLHMRNIKFNEYTTDPIDLFCFEFIIWLKSSPIHNEKELNTRIEYLTSISMLPLATKHYDIFKTTLKNSIKILREIQSHVVFESLRNEVMAILQDLIECSSHIILQLLTYLFYVARDTFVTTIRHFSGMDPYNSFIEDNYKELKETLSGQFLLQLAYSKSMQESFARYCGNTKIHQDEIDSLNSPFTFLEPSNHMYTAEPQTVIRLMQSSGNTRYRSGVHSLFLEDKEFLNNFIEVHGLFELFCDFIVSCKKLSDLFPKARPFLLVEAELSFIRQLSSVLYYYGPLRTGILTRLAQLEENIEKHLKESPSLSTSPWQKNYQFAIQQHLHIKQIFAHIETRISEISKATYTLLNEKEPKALFNFYYALDQIRHNTSHERLAPDQNIHQLQELLQNFLYCLHEATLSDSNNQVTQLLERVSRLYRDTPLYWAVRLNQPVSLSVLLDILSTHLSPNEILNYLNRKDESEPPQTVLDLAQNDPVLKFMLENAVNMARLQISNTALSTELQDLHTEREQREAQEREETQRINTIRSTLIPTVSLSNSRHRFRPSNQNPDPEEPAPSFQ